MMTSHRGKRTKNKVKYRYLTPSHHPWRQQFYVKDRNQTVGQLVAILKAEDWTPEEAAENLELPVAVIHEALDYYHHQHDLIEAEAAEERRRLEEKGIPS
jgi:uncharacterized protein (DUF433 family)